MTDDAPVRLAVVGAGQIGRRHLLAIEAETSCQAVAVVDPSPMGAATAKTRGLPHFSSLDEMFKAVMPEGVINATPNAMHVPLSLQCVRRGVPVLVEKPIADTLEAARLLADASEASDTAVLVGLHRRHNPIIRKAREIVQSGKLGGLVAVSATWLVRKPDDYFEVSWRRQPGGGPVLINLIHDIDNLRFIAGEISTVQAITSSDHRGFAVEDTAAILLRFGQGALATVMMSDSAVSPWSWELTAGERTSYAYPRTGQDCYLFAGTLGALAVPSLRIWHHEGKQSWQSPLPEERVEIDEKDPIRAQIAHFAEVIRGRAEPLITARDAARTLEATLAVTESATTSREINLSV